MTEKEFVSRWIARLRQEELKKFPEDFLNEENLRWFNNNSRKLTPGSEFFGNYEVIDTSGNRVLTVENFEIAKYYSYASRGKPENFPVPLSSEAIVRSVKEYDKYLDSLLKEMAMDFQKHFTDSQSFNRIASKIFLSLDLQRF
jgi:hypothetical protein